MILALFFISGAGLVSLKIEFDAGRAMVGMDCVRQDESVFQARGQVLGDHEVVDSPSQVSGSGSSPETPPSVLVSESRVQVPEAVRVALGKEA